MATIHEETRGRDFKYPKWMIEAVCVGVVEEGKSQKEMAVKYQIPPSTIPYWVAAFRKRKAQSVTAEQGLAHSEDSESSIPDDTPSSARCIEGCTRRH
jgi:hypothetical protein